MNRNTITNVAALSALVGIAACDGSSLDATRALSPTAPAYSESFTENFNNGLGPNSRLEVAGAAPVFVDRSVIFTGGDNGGRGYLRTIDSDYAAENLVAEVTVTVPGDVGQDGIAFIGLGVGQAGSFFGEPSDQPAVYGRILPDDFFGPDFQVTSAIGGSHIEGEKLSVGGNGTHRVRMTWNRATRELRFAIDEDYAGGAFVPNAMSAPIIVPAGTFNATNARIFIGGNAGVSFSRLHVVSAKGNLSL